MSLTPAFLDELRARTLLSALIGKTVKLTKAGREFKGCCPFHNEKTPSFYVNDDKAFYHCFGCSAHGDAIRWMTEQRGLPFIDAVKELAQAAGMEMPAQDRQAVERAERAKGLHDVMQAAADWFEAQLGGLDGGDARALLERRKISDATRRAFNFGYAPDSRGKLRTALRDFGDALLIEAGLLIKVEDKEPYDRFRGRLMIPIRDPRGRVIAFGGRIIGDGEPKYLNSPDTPLFDKGRTLYNLDKAAPASRKTDRLIVVEGYMDVIALAQAGFGDVVAPNGTAVTEAQLERMWRMADVPVICLDGDAAGQKAAIRAAHRAIPPLQPGQSLVFVGLPPGKDPDDVVRDDGPAAFEALLSSPTPMVHVLYLSEKSSSDTTTPEGRAGLRSRLHSVAETAQNQLVRQEYNRSFNDLFYEDFGWKRAERNAIGKAILKTGPHGNRELYRQHIRSALYGLYRFPSVIPQALETIYQIRLVDDGMKEWRDRLADAADRVPRLEYDGVQSIFETRAVAPATALALQADFRFQWNIEERWAVRKLIGLVHLLHEEQEIDERMAELNAKLIADLSLDSFDAVEAERVLLREQKRALYDMGYDLGVEELEQDN